MTNKKTTLIQELTWAEARSTVQKADRKLADVIDQINPDKKHTLIKVTYRFGDLILKDGMLQVPLEGSGLLLPITHPMVDKKLKEKLSYNSAPLFLTLKNSNEVFIDTGSRIAPLNLFDAGSLLGIFESTDYLFGKKSESKWSIAAGSRSIFMLPKINESTGFKRLRTRFDLPSNTKLMHTSDHWNTFKAIANHPNFTQPWQNEILFFSKEWLVNHKNDPTWMAFHNYIIQSAWHRSQAITGKVELNLIWESFLDAISSRRLKPSPYLANQVKHIMLIATNKLPGFRPADNLQKIGPTKGLQEAFVETYMLKQHLPTLMHASLLNAEKNSPVYYSLACPTLLEKTFHNKNSSTIMLDLREIKLLLDILISSSKTNKKFDYNTIKKIIFDYFHVETDKYREIKPSKLIPETDPAFLINQSEHHHLNFCFTSPFWRGCIKILNEAK